MKNFLQDIFQNILNTAGQVGLALFFTTFLLGLFVYVMTRNYRRMIREEFLPELFDGERELDRLDITGAVASSRTVLTDRRIIQLNLSWLFSKRKRFAVAWTDTYSVALKRSTGWIALIVAALLARGLHPAAFLLVLWGLDSRAYTIVFETPFALMPWTRVYVRSRDRAALRDLVRFSRTGQSIWSQVRTGPATAVVDHAPSTAVTEETDFRFGATVWIWVLVVMTAGIAQRIRVGNVGFDSMLFGPVFIAAPVAAAQSSRRDGLWVVLLAFVGLLTVKFPATGLTGIIANKGGMPYFTEYVGVFVTLALMSEASALLSRNDRALLSPLAALLWVPYVALHMPAVALDLSLYARAIAAVAVCALAKVLNSAISEQWPTTPVKRA